MKRTLKNAGFLALALAMAVGCGRTRTKTVEREDSQSRKRAEEAEAELKERDQALEEIKKNVSSLEKQLEESRSIVKTESAAVEAKEVGFIDGIYESAEVKEQIGKFLQGKVDELGGQIAAQSAELAATESRISAEQESLNKVSGEIATLEGEMTDAAREFLAAGSEEFRTYNDLLVSRTKAFEIRDSAVGAYEKAKKDVETLPGEIAAVTALIEQHKAEIASIEAQFQADPTSVTVEENKIPQLTDLIKQCEKKIEAQTASLTAQSAQIAEQAEGEQSPNLLTSMKNAEVQAVAAEKAVSDLEAKMNTAKEAALSEKRAAAEASSQKIAQDKTTSSDLSQKIAAAESSKARYASLLEMHTSRVTPPAAESTTPVSSTQTTPSEEVASQPASTQETPAAETPAAPANETPAPPADPLPPQENTPPANPS